MFGVGRVRVQLVKRIAVSIIVGTAFEGVVRQVQALRAVASA